MPMIDVFAPDDMFPKDTDRELATSMTTVLLRAEGVRAPTATHLKNTAAYIHRLPPGSVHTAATDSTRTVRVQILTPPGVFTRAGQKQLVDDVTSIVAEISGDPSQVQRTWVLLTEASEGGWGIPGKAFGREEFAALQRR